MLGLVDALTVPFMAKMKTIRKREKYLAPLFSANMKMKHPVSTIGTGYMKNQKRLPTRRVQERPDDHEDVWRGGEEEVRDVVGVVEGVFCQGWEEVLEAVRW
jgi:hypothetical protein